MHFSSVQSRRASLAANTPLRSNCRSFTGLSVDGTVWMSSGVSFMVSNYRRVSTTQQRMLWMNTSRLPRHSKGKSTFHTSRCSTHHSQQLKHRPKSTQCNNAASSTTPPKASPSKVIQASNSLHSTSSTVQANPKTGVHSTRSRSEITITQCTKSRRKRDAFLGKHRLHHPSLKTARRPRESSAGHA